VAVLVEAISVIVRIDSVLKLVPDGWDGYERLVSNSTLCADEEIARVGFMSPVDVESYIKKLCGLGLEFLRDGAAIDIAVADQIHGLNSACSWLQFGRVPTGDAGARVAACRLTGGKSKVLVTPLDWKFENSLSSTYAFVPNEHVQKGMQFLRHENGLDIYDNPLTGKEAFVGRTGDR
jgi:hypothetical protein